ncbi:MAG: hypothetical protein GTN64_05740 [Candidatus Latescibacteria bacterium]|nr:hypothetical protein [Candidatus Latescibacterota bacterium]NIO78111.1 hypothetical protein [Candidatus Latescibacterota bacterium]
MTGPLSLLERWLSYLSTNSAPVIEGAHLHAHEGEAYEGGYVFSGVADAGQVRMVMIPNDTDEPAHLFLSAVAGGRGILHFFEAPTIIASGTFVGGENLNRQLASAQPADWLTYRDPSIGNVGTELHVGLIPGGIGANPVGSRAAGTVRAGLEWVLNTGTAYLVTIQNQAGATIPVQVILEWYEEGL